MKNSTITCSLLSLIMCTGFLSLAQISISLEDFPRQASFMDTVVLSSDGSLALPGHGTAQVWDYSSVETDEIIVNTYFDATGETDFPDALNYHARDLVFQGFGIESNEYESLNANGWNVAGRSITDVSYPITGITGGPNDKLRFVGGNYVYGGLNQQLQFPLAYGDEYNTEYQADLDYELTVTAFGLNNTPGKNIRYFTQSRQVVGEGKCIIPDEDGNPSAPIDALIIKVVRTAVDSIFLGGAPAPVPLLIAFGLTQGAMASDSFYVAYTPGFGAPVFSMDITESQTTNFVYRPAAARFGEGGVSTIEPTFIDFYINPNPVTRGHKIQIDTDQLPDLGAIQIINGNGQTIYSDRLYQTAKNVTVNVPQDIPSGIYFILLKDKKDSLVGQKRILVN